MKHEQLMNLGRIYAEDFYKGVVTPEELRKSLLGKEVGNNSTEVDRGNDELIRKQDAIETIACAIWHYPNLSFLSDYDHAHELAEDALKRLPSAEPEVIYCKDCKHASPNGEYGCKSYHYRLYECHEMGADDFCSYGERRTDEADYRKE